MKAFDNQYLRRIVYVIQILMSIVLMAVMYSANLIPIMYMIIIGIILLLMLIGEYFLIFYKKKKSKRSLITQLMSLSLSCLLLFSSFVVYKTTKTVDLMTTQAFQTRAISVIVLKDSMIHNEKDLKQRKLGYMSNVGEQSMKYAQNSINQDIGKVELKENKDMTTLIDGLYHENVDAIILDEAFRSLVEQDYKQFNEQTRVVYQIKQEQDMIDAKNVDVTTKPFLVYVSGIDEYGDLSTISRSDVNMLVLVQPQTSQILLLSIPRDTYFPLNMNGEYDKFTHTGIYGLQESINTLQDMLNEEINYYARMNFTSFLNIVDALQGVTVYSPHEFVTVKGHYQIHKGNNEMDSKKALAFVRERKSFLDGDFERGRNQQRMISAIIKKICSPAILASYGPVLDSVSQSIETNLSSDEMNALIQMQLSKMINWDIQTYQIQGDPASLPCYSSGGLNASVIVPNENSIHQAVEYIDQMMSGKRITIETTNKGE